MTKAAEEKAAREEVCSELRASMPMGTRVHYIVKRVSQSGMSRVIAFYIIRDGEPEWVDMRAAGFKVSTSERGYVVKGCGMDMAFHAIYSLAHALYGNGYAFQQGRSL